MFKECFSKRGYPLQGNLFLVIKGRTENGKWKTVKRLKGKREEGRTKKYKALQYQTNRIKKKL